MLTSIEEVIPCESCGVEMEISHIAPFTNVECPACHEMMRVKCEFGPYTLTRRHAVGGMSMVFVAMDRTLGREVILKILSEEFSSDKKRVKALAEEARITASFNHPNVVRVLTTGTAFGRFYIAMEFVTGQSLEFQIEQRGRLSELEMLPLAIQIAQGLQAASVAGLLHRDVKPGNLLLDRAGHVKILDFGLALLTHGGKAHASEMWATPYYVSPETLQGAPEDIRTDIYSFGATLYHALAGTPSCGTECMSTAILKEAKKKVTPLGTCDPALSAQICRIVDRAMAYEPRDRFPSYVEMLDALEVAWKQVKSGSQGSIETSGVAAKRNKKYRQGMVAMLSIAALLLSTAVSGALWWVKRETPPMLEKPKATLPNLPQVPKPPLQKDVGKAYREARSLLEAGDHEKAMNAFVAIRNNAAVPEPTRSWAGVEAVTAAYLGGFSSQAKQEALACAVHAASVPESGGRLGDSVIKMLQRTTQLPTIPVDWLDTSNSDASHMMAWVLAGLKNWDQGMTVEAVGYFSAVSAAKIPTDAPWLEFYQKTAKDYLADERKLSGLVFEKLPTDAAGCEVAMGNLELILGDLKTQGRARFNVRAWQLDIAKHSKQLSKQ